MTVNTDIVNREQDATEDHESADLELEAGIVIVVGKTTVSIDELLAEWTESGVEVERFPEHAEFDESHLSIALSLVLIGSGVSPDETESLISSIRARGSLSHVPAVMVTPVSTELRGRLFDAGLDEAIVDGMTAGEIKSRIDRLIRTGRQWDELSSKYLQASARSMSDQLTGLHNTRYLHQFLPREIHSCRRYGYSVSLLFGDLDLFKRVNDRYGHLYGDRVLQGVAETIKETVRQSDTVIRYGGEEFVMILPYTSSSEAHDLAERIRDAVCNFRLKSPDEDCDVSITMSIGVSTFPENASSSEMLLQNADNALYSAKQAGRNRAASFGNESTSDSGTARVLIADDSDFDRLVLEEFLKPHGYEIITARNGKEALDIAHRERPDIVLLDAVMPPVNGFDVCHRLKQNGETCLIPIVLVTSLGSDSDKLRGIESGADDFLTKPVRESELIARIKSLLRTKRRTDSLENAEAVIFTLARAVEARDPSTGSHVERVSHYAVALGRKIGLGRNEIIGLRQSGIVHDIGKVAIPDAILLKPGKLTQDERTIIEAHVEIGYELLKPLRTFSDALPAVLYHHERLDGSGYPRGLKGTDVPIMAQILAIVDVYDALTTDRVYRSAFSHQEASDMLFEEVDRGLHSRELVETFLHLITDQIKTSE